MVPTIAAIAPRVAKNPPRAAACSRDVTDSANRPASSLPEGAAPVYSIHGDLHRGHRRTRRRDRHHQGLAAQPAVERQDPLPDRPRRHRLHPGGDGRRPTSARRRSAGRSPRPGERRSSSPARSRADARAPGGYELDVSGLEVVSAGARLPDHAEGARRRLPDGPPPPVDPRASGSTRSCASATRSSTRSATSSTRTASSSPTRRSSRRRRARARRRCSRSQYFEDTTAYLTQSGQLYNEANAMALGKVYASARRSAPRREDAPPPDRVLDGRARDGLRRPRRRDGPGRGPDRRRSSRACSTSGSRELKVLERDTSKLEAVKAPFPRITTTRRSKILLDKGLPFEWGGDFGGTDETVLSEQFDRPVLRHHYPAAIKAFYMKPDPERPELRAVRRRARARRLRRDHRRRPAPGRSTTCCCSASRSTTCRRKRSSGISTCAATARCRTAASAWASSAASAGSAASSTCARRFRTRACCTGCIRDGPRCTGLAKLQQVSLRVHASRVLVLESSAVAA